MADAWKVNKLAEKGGKLFERDRDKIGHTTPHKVEETIDKGSSYQYPPISPKETMEDC